MKKICPKGDCRNRGGCGHARPHVRGCYCVGWSGCPGCIHCNARQHYRDKAVALAEEMAKECKMSKVDAKRDLHEAMFSKGEKR